MYSSINCTKCGGIVSFEGVWGGQIRWCTCPRLTSSGSLLYLECPSCHKIHSPQSNVIKSLPSDFLNNNRIEIVCDLSQQYLCYINYKEGDGAYGLGMTFLEALQNGIEKYKERGNVW